MKFQEIGTDHLGLVQVVVGAVGWSQRWGDTNGTLASGHVKVTPSSNICGTYLVNILDISGTYQGHIWDISGTYQGHIWDISGTYLGHIWDISRIGQIS